MANLKSSKKDIRRAEKRRIANSQKKSAIRTYAKSIQKSLKTGNKEEAIVFFQQYSSLLDKAAKKNIVHKKNASRRKSRMAKKINSLATQEK